MDKMKEIFCTSKILLQETAEKDWFQTCINLFPHTGEGRAPKQSQELKVQPKVMEKLVQVAHACNPSYSGDRTQEDHGSKPALDKQFT
jgi:hypothetical protein